MSVVVQDRGGVREIACGSIGPHDATGAGRDGLWNSSAFIDAFMDTPLSRHLFIQIVKMEQTSRRRMKQETREEYNIKRKKKRNKDKKRQTCSA